MKQFEEIWKEYYPKLSVFLRTTFRFKETDDLVQDIMLKVYSSLGSFNPVWSLNTWIYAIARNHALDVIRKDAARLRIIEKIRHEASLSGGSNMNTEAILIREETKKDIAAFINSLPENERQVSFLKYYEEMNYREISHVTGIPVGTIKYLVHRIKIKLKEYLGDNYELL